MIRSFARALHASQEGSTALEYALVASLIAAALSGSIMALGASVQSHYDTVETEYAEAND